MNERYVVAANRGSIRIYQHRQEIGQTTPGFALVQQLDLPGGRAPFNAYLTDQAGRFPSQPDSGSYKGMSIDERLPGQEEHEKRAIDEVARNVEAFLEAHRPATWDFAAPPGVHHAVLERISPAVRQRLRRTLAKDLTKQPVTELREHFSA